MVILIDRNTAAAAATLHNNGLTARLLPNGWLAFRFRELRVQALIHDEPSPYGIREGRISKLWAVDTNTTREVLNYDRGWDTHPATPEAQALLDDLHRLFPQRLEVTA